MIIKKYKKKIIQPTLFAVVLVAAFAAFQVLEFSNGATDSDSVTLTLTVEEALSLDCGSDVDLGSLTPGTPVSASTTCTVSTNDEDGYDLQVKRDDPDTTMDNDADASVNITDKLAWDPTSGGGNGNANTWSGTGLGFSVYDSDATKNETWWGTGSSCHDALNEYAGFPAADTNIMEHTAYSGTATDTSICYRVDTPATQRPGDYTGVVTYTATGNP